MESTVNGDSGSKFARGGEFGYRRSTRVTIWIPKALLPHRAFAYTGHTRKHGEDFVLETSPEYLASFINIIASNLKEVTSITQVDLAMAIQPEIPDRRDQGSGSQPGSGSGTRCLICKGSGVI